MASKIANAKKVGFFVVIVLSVGYTASNRCDCSEYGEAMRKRKAKGTANYREALIGKLKGDEKAQFAYLKASLEENADMPEVFLKAIETVAKARGLSRFAKKAGLNRENLYRIFSNERSPRLETLHKILDALGFKLTITPKKAS